MSLVHRRVVVDVPATSANLGAGFDAVGLALELRNRVSVEAREVPGVELSVEGEGHGRLPVNGSNRVVVALETGLRWALGEVPREAGWQIVMRNEIPLERGLGSSAAAVVAGLVAADALAGGRLGQRRMLGLAAELEGHADNAAAALLGGFVVVAPVAGRPEAVRLEPPRRLRTVLFVPEVPLTTASMRAALPEEVPHADAVHNVGRAALLVAAMAAGRLDLLAGATEDRLHEPYRARVFPQLPRLVRTARDAGAYGACLSGAGSSVLAFVDAGPLAGRVAAALAEAAEDLDLPGSVRTLAPRAAGALVMEQE